MVPIPGQRLVVRNDVDPRGDGAFVVYWMTASRRTSWSFALQHALWCSERLSRPLIVLEALRVGYPYASARLHRAILDGMEDNRRDFASAGVTYYPYVEPSPGAGRGLLGALASGACLIVGDELPTFFLPRMIEAAARIGVRLETVDGCGVLPLRATARAYTTAASFRRHLHRALAEHLDQRPLAVPLEAVAAARGAVVPDDVLRRWPSARGELLTGAAPELLAELPIDHSVPTVVRHGGARAAEGRWREFLGGRLDLYARARGHPDDDATTGLSPDLHFGHISAHQIVSELLARESWGPERLHPRSIGRREGFFGVGASAEALLDQILTWRELGLATAFHEPATSATWEGLPRWARDTLEEHRSDRRPASYSLAELERAETDDEVWNAAQRQLLGQGTIHNSLRMLWGKKILEWSPSPELALERLFALNDRWALDGRDPNSVSGIMWCLGKYDRPWGPERPVLGKVRYMSSRSARRKLRLRRYLSEWGRPGLR